MSGRRRPLRLALALLGGGALGIGIACIIPDRAIQVLTTDFNQYPVRFVEGIPLTEEARCACSSTCECPMPDPTFLPTYLDPTDPAYQFCICGDNKIDEGRLYGVSLFAEDQDEDEGEPADSLYMVALLDWDPTLNEPAFDYVAYRSYLDPREPLPLATNSSYENTVIKRPRPYVREASLRDENTRFDLCNGAGRPLTPGFHTVTFMVTDRPWFTRDSEVVETDTGTGGGPVQTPVVELEGVPDIAAGATYDIQTYVFQCLEEGDDNCGCVELGEDG